jgi:hypothetical protein
MIRLLALLMLLVGCLWILAIAWAYISLSGLSVPVSIRVVLLEYGAMLIPPGVMIVGSVLILTGVALRSSAILIGIACLVLTGIVVYPPPSLHPNPLQVRPAYLLYVVLTVLVLLADFAAFRLYQLTSRPGEWAGERKVVRPIEK